VKTLRPEGVTTPSPTHPHWDISWAEFYRAFKIIRDPGSTPIPTGVGKAAGWSPGSVSNFQNNPESLGSIYGGTNNAKKLKLDELYPRWTRLLVPGTDISDLKSRGGQVTGEDFPAPAEEDPSAP
jgi:hypothetical protein